MRPQLLPKRSAWLAPLVGLQPSALLVLCKNKPKAHAKELVSWNGSLGDFGLGKMPTV